jgi:hypothetical protein
MKHDGTSDGELFHYSCMVWIIQTNLKKKKKKKNRLLVPCCTLR